MRPFAGIARHSVVGLAVGCTVLALACGGTSTSQSGAGGSGAGGVSGNGGATPEPDAAVPGTGGTTTGAGGTTTVTSTPPGSGGVTATGGARTGGTTTVTGAGGTTTVTGAGGTTTLTGAGGRTGAGGTVASGGVTATGGGTGPGGDGGMATGGRTATGGTAGGGTGGGTTLPRTGGAGGGGVTGTSSGAVPSAGCGKAPPADGRQNISVGGTSREFILKIPDNYDNNHPYRLIFGFHGAKYNDDRVATGVAGASGTNLSGPWFGLEAESSGSAIFVAPQASGSGWGDADLPFVDAMVAQFESQLCIDQSRIFSTGFSMGAIMTLTLGCNRADVFRAIAPMSGRLPTSCPDSQPLAYWASHGTNDTTIPIANGEAARDSYVKRNHCTTQTSTPNSNNCVTYQGCDAGYPVIWCTFPGVHDPAPFAGPEIWSFLAPL
jgi:polyhydroxybutyrate depolymerase